MAKQKLVGLIIVCMLGIHFVIGLFLWLGLPITVGHYLGGSPWHIGLSLGVWSVVIIIYAFTVGHRVADFTYWKPRSKLLKWAGATE